MPKFVSADQAVAVIKDGSALGISSFGGWLGTDELYAAVSRRCLTEGHPRDLRLFGGILPGGLDARDVGANILAQPGLIAHVTAAHVGMSPRFAAMIANGDIAAHALPLGVFTKLLRCSAAHEPGIVTDVGLGSFCDPRLESCRLNEEAKGYESPVSLISLMGSTRLFYPAFRLDACFIRASCADEEGNLSIEDEPVTGDIFAMAAAVHNNGGAVIAQVSRRVPAGSIPPRSVAVHGSMVDYIVLATPERGAPGYDCPQPRPELTSRRSSASNAPEPIALDHRLLCARRAALELRRGCVVNLGIGIPDGIALVAAQEGLADELTLSLESGPLGGVPVSGVGFGAAVSPQAIYSLADNLDLYDGGGLDMAFLGAAEVDRFGNVNVSRFADRVTGPGGFIDIAQNTGSVCFMGTFTAGGLRVRADNGRLDIVREGRSPKFRERVEQVTFSAATALERGQRVLYITERAVFTLTERGLTLTELAPGMDLERDILAHMDFVPVIADTLSVMDAAIFTPQPMGLGNRIGR